MELSIFNQWIAIFSDRWSTVFDQLKDVLLANWHLGFTAFGGPPVHFRILHVKFVDKLKWIDEQMYQEIFAISQALPGPASTKMLFCINVIHGGLISGYFAFMLWCLPGAIGMYGLSLGVASIGDSLPEPVFALLSGLNAATVGIIALAAVELSNKTITDKLSRTLIFFTGVAGMLYTALWYFPVLMAAAGVATVVWDYRWLHSLARRLRRRQESPSQPDQDIRDVEGTRIFASGASSSTQGNPGLSLQLQQTTTTDDPDQQAEDTERTIPSNLQIRALTWKAGVYVIVGFVISFILVMSLRSLLHNPPQGMSLFANLYLAGTIIFGGGPVVVPLLREYVVAEGWVSPRDFLLGLALIQSFPGPNFNFAVYLGALATVNTPLPSFSGAVIGFLGIFAPGIIIVTGVMGLWRVLRSQRWLISLLRGVNAGAVGLVYTAVYKLSQTGYIDANNDSGSYIGRDPWWVAISATSYVGGAWFGLKAPFAILLGGVMGMIWYAVVKA